MLKATHERMDGRLLARRPVYNELIPLLREPLKSVRLAVELNPELAGVGSDDVGLKVWLLPHRYLQYCDRDQAVRRALLTWSAEHLDRPSMVLAGELRAVRSTGSRWAMGKGLIGAAIFGEGNGAGTKEGFYATVHSEFGDRAQLPWWRFKNLPDEDRRNRRRRDMKALQNTYASAVAVGIREAPGERAFGCITLDTPVGTELTKVQQEACGDILVAKVPQVVTLIVNEGGYRSNYA